MTTLNVPEMHCQMCVARITKAMEEAKIACRVDLQAKTVEVETTRVEDAIAVLDDLGFDARR